MELVYDGVDNISVYFLDRGCKKLKRQNNEQNVQTEIEQKLTSNEVLTMGDLFEVYPSREASKGLRYRLGGLPSSYLLIRRPWSTPRSLRYS